MSETQVVTHRTVGYDWAYSIEIETVTPPIPPARASAKTTEKFSTGGNTVTFEEMKSEMMYARKQIREEAGMAKDRNKEPVAKEEVPKTTGE
jgi:hypothetical protein